MALCMLRGIWHVDDKTGRQGALSILLPILLKIVKINIKIYFGYNYKNYCFLSHTC